jgi:hypothetical protein
MSRLKPLLIALFLLGTTGCASFWNARETSSCPADPRENLNTPGCIRATAALGYEYGVLAALAYEPQASPDLAPPAGVVEAESCMEIACDGAKGYQYRVFHRVRDRQVAEKIIAFRGTDGKGDWSTNLFGRKDQNRAALATFLKVRGDGTVPVSVTGDSLGGALAIQVSMCHPVHRRVALDASPRFYKSLCPGGRALPRPADADTKLLLFSETGEILSPTRWLGRNPDQLATRVNCIVGENTISQHDVRRLAACMIHRAVEGGSEEARRYRDANRPAFDRYLNNPQG